MTIEIKMEIIKADEVSVTNISYPSFGKILAMFTNSHTT